MGYYYAGNRNSRANKNFAVKSAEMQSRNSQNEGYPGSVMMRERGWNPYRDEEEPMQYMDEEMSRRDQMQEDHGSTGNNWPQEVGGREGGNQPQEVGGREGGNQPQEVSGRDGRNQPQEVSGRDGRNLQQEENERGGWARDMNQDGWNRRDREMDRDGRNRRDREMDRDGWNRRDREMDRDDRNRRDREMDRDGWNRRDREMDRDGWNRGDRDMDRDGWNRGDRDIDRDGWNSRNRDRSGGEGDRRDGQWDGSMGVYGTCQRDCGSHPPLMMEMPELNHSEQETMKQWNQASSGQSCWRASESRNGQPYQRYDYLNVLEDEQMMEKELRKLQSMYPQAARDILPLVEEVCDKMEYEGSMMFDEHPDQNAVRRMSDHIYGQVRELYPEEEEQQPEEMQSMEYQDRRRRPPHGNFLNDLVQVMLVQEMHRRRCRHHRCRPRRY